MSKITPFRAWHYDFEKFHDLSALVAPPYDVIDALLYRKLTEGSPHNVAWIDLPQDLGDGQDRYAVAAQRWREWQQSGVVVQDEKPALYLYFQTYRLADGREFTRRGFFACRSLEEFHEGGVKPHEKTFAGPKEDRLKLTQATEANLSSIFGLFSDPEGQVGELLTAYSSHKPDVALTDASGQEHRLWRIDDAEKIETLLRRIHDSTVMIADGHHRYETALKYRELQRAKGAATAGADSVLMYFCPLQDPGLIVLPTHRVLGEKPELPVALAREQLAKFATSESFPLDQSERAIAALQKTPEEALRLAWVHEAGIDVLTFTYEALLQSGSLNHLHPALRNLDVTVLHDLVLTEIFGIPKGAQREYGTIHYVKDAAEALRLTEEKQTYGFLMNATQIHQIEAVTEIGETMPQKSTFFYPKVLTGLVFNDLR